jgi:hypothetical protein
MTWLTSAFSAIGSVLSMAATYFGLKNAPDQKRAEVAKQIDGINQENTDAVRDAIKSGDISKLQK